MTLAQLLAPFGVSEDQFVAALSGELNAAPNAAASRLTDAEEAVLHQHGGIAERVGEDVLVRKAALRSASANLAELTRESLSVEQAAKLLRLDGSRVRHRVRDRALYAFKIGASLRLPAWQFRQHEAIPGLRTVLAALPQDLHPLEVAGFMTIPDTDLAVAGRPLSPRDWLVGGGDVTTVVELIEHVDAW